MHPTKTARAKTTPKTGSMMVLRIESRGAAGDLHVHVQTGAYGALAHFEPDSPLVARAQDTIRVS